MRTIHLSILLSFLMMGIAYAGEQYELDIQVDGNGDVKSCTRKSTGAVAGTNDKLLVKASGTTKAKLRISAGAQTKELAKGSPSVTFPDAPYKDEDITVVDANTSTEVCKTEAQDENVKDKQPEETNAEGRAKETTTFSSIRSVYTDTALLKLNQDKVNGHASSGGVHGNVYKLYHLPDGTPAFPLPSHISDEDELEVWIVLPPGASAKLDVIACDKVPGFRVDGSYKDASAAVGKLQGGGDPSTYVTRSVGSRMQCAGTLTYKIETTGSGESQGLSGTTTTSISIDPIYRFEWGVGYMFDFARPHSLSLGDRPAEDGMSTEKFVIDSRDSTGARPIVTLAVNVCGTNPRKLDWCDRLINPSVWIDPQRLMDGFGVGLGLRPFYGLTLVAGATVFKSMAVADGTKVNAGETWTAAGDLPTKNVFNKDSVGFGIAVVVSTEIFAKLLP